jgi:hypothetical protein
VSNQVNSSAALHQATDFLPPLLRPLFGIWYKINNYVIREVLVNHQVPINFLLANIHVCCVEEGVVLLGVGLIHTELLKLNQGCLHLWIFFKPIWNLSLKVLPVSQGVT